MYLFISFQVPYLGGPGLEGSGLTDHQVGLVQRFDPSILTEEKGAQGDTIGFFIAKFIKGDGHCH